jgi:hypothetical protein
VLLGGIKDKFAVLDIAFPVSSSEISCSDAQGISLKAPSFWLIEGVSTH